MLQCVVRLIRPTFGCLPSLGQIKIDKTLLELDEIYIETTLSRSHESWTYRRDGPSYPYWTVKLDSQTIVKMLWRAEDATLVSHQRPLLRKSAILGEVPASLRGRPLPLELAPSCPKEEHPECAMAYFALLLDGAALEPVELKETWSKQQEREILILTICLRRRASIGLSIALWTSNHTWNWLSRLRMAGTCQIQEQKLTRIRTKSIHRAQARSVVFVPTKKSCCDQQVNHCPELPLLECRLPVLETHDHATTSSYGSLHRTHITNRTSYSDVRSIDAFLLCPTWLPAPATIVQASSSLVVGACVST